MHPLKVVKIKNPFGFLQTSFQILAERVEPIFFIKKHVFVKHPNGHLNANNLVNLQTSLDFNCNYNMTDMKGSSKAVRSCCCTSLARKKLKLSSHSFNCEPAESFLHCCLGRISTSNHLSRLRGADYCDIIIS